MANLPRRVREYESSTYGEHKYGNGKFFLKKKKVYLEDKLAQKWDAPELMKEYLQYCQEQGLEMQKIEFGEFQSKNGYKYHGFRATEEIYPHDVLIKVPNKLILNTKICMFSDIQIIVKENMKFFTANKGGLIEDYIMLIFLLRQYQLGRESPWFYLINNLPRDIDIIDFWKDEEHQLLDDEEFLHQIKQQRIYFKYVCKSIRTILKKYPLLFNEDIFSEENIKWIYIHIWSRSFGGSMDYVSMVPIVEMMNHENTNLYFRIYKDGQRVEKTEISDEQRDAHTSSSENESDSSDNEDIIVSSECVELNKEYSNKIESKIIKVDIKDKSLKDVQLASMELEMMLINDLNLGDHLSIFFVSKVLDKLVKLKQSLVDNKINISDSLDQINRLNELCQFYIQLLKAYHHTSINENLVINSAQKAIFQKDAIEAQQAIQSMRITLKEDNIDLNHNQEEQRTSEEKEEKISYELQKNEDTQQSQSQGESITDNNHSQQNIDSQTKKQSQQQQEIEYKQQTQLLLQQQEERKIQEQQNKQNQQHQQEQSQQQQQQQSEQQQLQSQLQQEQSQQQQSQQGQQILNEQEYKKEGQEIKSELDQEEEKKKEEDEDQEKDEKEKVEYQELNNLVLEYSENRNDWKEIDYDSCILMADEEDKFEKGSQVYFCYNRLPNREMLCKYGISLEYNKYEKLKLRYNYIDDLVQYAPYSFQYIQYFNLNQCKSFKITHNSFNTKIISFAKIMYWDLSTQKIESIFSPTINLKLELRGLLKVKSIYEQYLSSRKFTEQQNEQMLFDNQLSGHEYFAAVYRLENMRVIKNQLNLVNVCIHIIQDMLDNNIMGQQLFQKWTPFDNKDDSEDYSFNRNRYILRKYIQYFPKDNIQF